MRRAVFPGSFDPITLGHQDIIQRALPFFDEIVIAVGVNQDKNYLFPLEKRIQFIEETFSVESKVKVTSYTGLTVAFCKEIKASAILRGLRNPADFEFEKSIAHINRHLSGIETLFLLTATATSYVSSSIVREVMRNHGDYKQLVPAAVKYEAK